MSLELCLYGARSERVELPAVTLQNWSFRIAAETSGFGYDLVVPLVVMHDQWCVASSTDFQLWRAGRPHFDRPLAAGDTYFLEVAGKGAVFIQALPLPERIPTWQRYLLRKLS